MNPTEPAYIYRATADRIIDGDTFVADVDLGFNVHAKVTVRIYGIDAPEHDAPGGPEATQFLTDTLIGPVNAWRLLLRSHKDQRSFARWVCEVFFPDGESLADDLIAHGHAVPYPPAKP